MLLRIAHRAYCKVIRGVAGRRAAPQTSRPSKPAAAPKEIAELRHDNPLKERSGNRVSCGDDAPRQLRVVRVGLLCAQRGRRQRLLAAAAAHADLGRRALERVHVLRAERVRARAALRDAVRGRPRGRRRALRRRLGVAPLPAPLCADRVRGALRLGAAAPRPVRRLRARGQRLAAQLCAQRRPHHARLRGVHIPRLVDGAQRLQPEPVDNGRRVQRLRVGLLGVHVPHADPRAAAGVVRPRARPLPLRNGLPARAREHDLLRQLHVRRARRGHAARQGAADCRAAAAGRRHTCREDACGSAAGQPALRARQRGVVRALPRAGCLFCRVADLRHGRRLVVPLGAGGPLGRGLPGQRQPRHVLGLRRRVADPLRAGARLERPRAPRARQPRSRAARALLLRHVLVPRPAAGLLWRRHRRVLCAPLGHAGGARRRAHAAHLRRSRLLLRGPRDRDDRPLCRDPQRPHRDRPDEVSDDDTNNDAKGKGKGVRRAGVRHRAAACRIKKNLKFFGAENPKQVFLISFSFTSSEMKGTCKSTLATLAWLGGIASVSAHQAIWNKGMYCLKSNDGSNNMNNDAPVAPLFNLTKADWWFQGGRNCSKNPPPDGDYLELPAGGALTVEIASNRAFTSFGNSEPTGEGINGVAFPYDAATGAGISAEGCVTNPNLHTKPAEAGAGSAIAISYNSRMEDVTMENLVVFTVAYNSPYKRLQTYQVPDLPACPEGGCHCVWGWSPSGCGEPNCYFAASKCIVVGATSTKKVGTARPPAGCAGDASKCTSGPKQIIMYNQLDGNNAASYTSNGVSYNPMYNMASGFSDGAQTDIFEEDDASAVGSEGGPVSSGGSVPSGTGSSAGSLGSGDASSSEVDSSAGNVGSGDGISTEEGSSAGSFGSSNGVSSEAGSSAGSHDSGGSAADPSTCACFGTPTTATQSTVYRCKAT